MTVLIIHGWLSTPNMHFFPWLKKELEARGMNVIAPQMPNPALPKRAEWLATLDEAVRAVGDPAQTILVGHSLGTLTILHYLNEIYRGPAFPNAVLCSSFCRPFTLPPLRDLPDVPGDHQQFARMREKILSLPEMILNDWFTTPIDFTRVRENVRAITCIHSTDDPIVPYEEGAWVAKQLRSDLITEQRGHFIEFRVTGRMTLPSALSAITG